MPDKILTVQHLVTQLKSEQGFILPVNDISFDVYQGKTLGIVGESGSGKSVTALSIMRLITPPLGSIIRGHIWLEGQDLLQLSHQEMRKVRGNKIAMIFQEPMTSLNPVFTAGYQIKEVLKLHQQLSSQAAHKQALELLGLVGISAPAKRMCEYPHQMSGGMRQRIMIAMALASNPAVLIADEPTTALDVTIQAQILDLLVKLQKELNMGMILITHDLGIVAEVCHEVAVMYAGKVIEMAGVKELFNHPKHPYTQGLLSAIPSIQSETVQEKRRLKTIKGVVPPLHDLPIGCSFQDRCYKVQQDCKGEQGPPSLEEKEVGHLVSCFHPL